MKPVFKDCHPEPVEGPLTISIFLVPKLHLGTSLSPQLRCFGGEAQLRRQVRSQVQLGNEGKVASCALRAPGQQVVRATQEKPEQLP